MSNTAVHGMARKADQVEGDKTDGNHYGGYTQRIVALHNLFPDDKVADHRDNRKQQQNDSPNILALNAAVEFGGKCLKSPRL